MPRRSSTSLLAILAFALAVAAPASAAPATFFPAEAIDGPVERVGDVDVARDGSGVVAYVKLDGGVPHVFVSRLVKGAWQPPERVDAGIAAAASDPVVAASDGGRLVVAFTAGGQLFYVVRPADATSWPAPVAGPAPAATPTLDMSVNGIAYLVWSAAGDVRAARLERKAVAFTALPAPLDIVPAAIAGDGSGRPRVAVAADGIATAVWGEGGHVFARRMFELRPSAAPQQLDVGAFKGLGGVGGDQPDLDTEDDSSFAWVAFRQALADGSTRVLARRLRGSQFDDPVDVGPTTESAGLPRVDLNGRGEGMVGSQGASRAPFAASLQNDQFAPTIALGGGLGIDPQPQPAVAEGGDAVVAWMSGSSAADASVHARAFDNGKSGAEAQLSNPALGAVDPTGGFDAASNRAGDVVVVFLQGSGDQRRLVAATYDRAPGAFVVNSSQQWRKASQPRLAWGAAFELWSPPTYTVLLDGVQIGQTTATRLTPTTPLTDGVHRLRVVATDRRGQSTSTKTRLIRVDSAAPEVTLRVSGTRAPGKALTFRRTVSDSGGSGIKSVVYAFDGGPPVTGPTVKRSFGAGLHKVTVTATDRAGNVTAVSKRLRIK